MIYHFLRIKKVNRIFLFGAKMKKLINLNNIKYYKNITKILVMCGVFVRFDWLWRPGRWLIGDGSKTRVYGDIWTSTNCQVQSTTSQDFNPFFTEIGATLAMEEIEGTSKGEELVMERLSWLFANSCKLNLNRCKVNIENASCSFCNVVVESTTRIFNSSFIVNLPEVRGPCLVFFQVMDSCIN